MSVEDNEDEIGKMTSTQDNGYNFHVSTSENGFHASTYGFVSHAYTNGDEAHSFANGNSSHAITVGYESNASTRGFNSISCALGEHSKARVENGWIILVDWRIEDESYIIIGIYHAKVGGKIKNMKIESDYWYWFEDGKIKKSKAMLKG